MARFGALFFLPVCSFNDAIACANSSARLCETCSVWAGPAAVCGAMAACLCSAACPPAKRCPTPAKNEQRAEDVFVGVGWRGAAMFFVGVLGGVDAGICLAARVGVSWRNVALGAPVLT